MLLRLIFAPKMKTAPPTGLGSRSCEGLTVIWTRKVEFFFWSTLKVDQEKWLDFGEDLFLFFGDHLIFFFLEITGKTIGEDRKNFNEDLFFLFGDHLISAGKTLSILAKTFFSFSEITWFLPEKPFQFWWRPCSFKSPDFDRKTASILFKIDENLGQVRLLLFSPLKKAFPFAKSWLFACHLWC